MSVLHRDSHQQTPPSSCLQPQNDTQRGCCQKESAGISKARSSIQFGAPCKAATGESSPRAPRTNCSRNLQCRGFPQRKKLHLLLLLSQSFLIPLGKANGSPGHKAANGISSPTSLTDGGLMATAAQPLPSPAFERAQKIPFSLSWKRH